MGRQLVDIILAIVSSLLASSGLWAYVFKKLNNRDAQNDMLIGLGHDRIMHLGMHYIKQGWISSDEYENLSKYLFEPYRALGGNGSAERIMKEVDKLTIR